MRLFVGLALPEDLRARLAGLKGGLRGARWVAVENLHLSLRFIGDVTGGIERDIDQALLAIKSPVFDIALSGLGCFDHRGKVRSVWAGVEESGHVTRLQGKVERALIDIGLEPDHRKYKPHVTLARLKNRKAGNAGEFMETHGGFRAGPFNVDRLTLFLSHLGSGGASYEVLADYPLIG